jgi:hypothetical protein
MHHVVIIIIIVIIAMLTLCYSIISHANQEIRKYTSNQERKTERCGDVTGWTRKHQDLNQLSAKISPDIAYQCVQGEF